MNVIFNRSLRIGKVTHHKSKKPVVLDDKLADDWFVKAMMESGDISQVVAKPAGKPAGKAAGKPAAEAE